MDVVVIGGGAAGFFGAITCASQNPAAKVRILEKTDKLLAKVKVSGGGRCNVTNACSSPVEFCANYPRGNNFLLQSFSQFSNIDLMQWFKKRNVPLNAEADGRVFPATNNSQTIIDCLLSEALKYKIIIQKKASVCAVKKNNTVFDITLMDGSVIKADKVLIATGGYPQLQQYKWIENIGVPIIDPIPSLFTFNIPKSPLKELMGVAQLSTVKINSSSMINQGPLLITHWGLSGPAVLKLSAYGARELHQQKYEFDITVNWTLKDSATIVSDLKKLRDEHPKKYIRTLPPFSFPKRLWEFFCNEAGIREFENWAELGNKKLIALSNLVSAQQLNVSGKTTFKEEFVTCGGISLKDVNPETMESLTTKGLFFAGEALDIDGITGGFNFQAAWTTSYIAGINISK